MKIVITGGGTGGHISPALALAEGLQQAYPATSHLLYIGHVSGLESQLVPEAGLRFETLSFSGMPRDKNPFRFLKWMAELAVAIWRARTLLLRFQPDVVVGTGGYVSAPVLIAARLLGIPFHIHEPDAQPGLVNRLMGRHARSISIAFETSRTVLQGYGVSPDQIYLTGNPLRQTIMTRLGVSGLAADALPREPASLSAAQRELLLRQLGFAPELSAKGLPLLLVLGGSQGARTLNHAVVGALPRLLDAGYLVLHQTGPKLFGETLDMLEALPPVDLPQQPAGNESRESAPVLVSVSLKDHPAYRCQAYINDMAPVLAASSIALCRSGSLSLSELLIAGVPMVLVPYPYAAANHQTRNAEALVKAGAAEMLTDADCTPERVFEMLEAMVSNTGQLRQMRSACARLATPYATQNIVSLIVPHAT